MIDAEAVHEARLLHTIADQFALEKTRWKARTIQAELEEHQEQIEAAARHTAVTGDAVYGEAFAYAATLTLRKYSGLRTFLEHITDDTKAGYQTLECRDGQHLACGECCCWCHHE